MNLPHILLVVSLAVPFGVRAEQTVTPNLRVEPARLLMGDVLQDSQVTTSFQLHNGSDEAIILERITPACGCTLVEADLPSILQPNNHKTFQVQFNAGSFSGNQDKDILISTSSGDIVLPLSAVVYPASGILIEPTPVVFINNQAQVRYRSIDNRKLSSIFPQSVAYKDAGGYVGITRDEGDIGKPLTWHFSRNLQVITPTISADPITLSPSTLVLRGPVGQVAKLTVTINGWKDPQHPPLLAIDSQPIPLQSGDGQYRFTLRATAAAELKTYTIQIIDPASRSTLSTHTLTVEAAL
jgi:hypothetical protein